ncbi:zinc-finger homeodomain protein 6-like [Durio zibethinus]|uniref:Zinc-finger homeodomain protein 6-like n=1 Tax=Durio zibethinus TaxID=66656 RepID=A0A6P5YIH7_DURZI|nr:zinc-finger homeodomain protein 6-like [Durio zibethinus]
MELRGQDKEMGIPSSFSYNNQLNRDSSSKIFSSSVPINSAVGERRRDQTVHGDTTILNPNPPQTLDHQSLYHPELNPHHQIHKPRRDPDPELDPVSAPIATTTSAIVTATANRSSLKSPQQQPPTSEPSPVAGPTSTTISSTPLIRYRECLKNHAASMGGHVVDGCGEFMPSGEEDTPEALKCAACECHRNFHRKEINGESQYTLSCYYTFNPNKNNTRRDTATVHPPPSQLHPQQPTPLHQQRFSLGLSTSTPTRPIAPLMINFGGGSSGGPAESSSEDLNMFHSNAGGQSSHPQSSRKRFRTKFSKEQKDKMMEFAEKLGWRIQKQDEQDVQQFCAQVGVKRQVLKVWMHNNKQAMKKKQM